MRPWRLCARYSELDHSGADYPPDKVTKSARQYAFISTLLFGWLADSINKPRLVSMFLFTAGISILFPLFGSSIGYLWIFILLFTTVEATYPVAWAMVGDIFGRKHFAEIRGYMSVFYVWGSVVGPVVAGAIWDR